METLQRTANRGSVSTGPYEIDNSCKFEADNTEFMDRITTTTGNRKTWTHSSWVKRTEISFAGDGFGHTFFFGGAYGSEGCILRFNTGTTAATLDTLQIDIGDGGTNSRSNTSQVFRDTSAWYHIVLAVDTTQSTATDRFKLYVNGELVTSYYSRTNPGQNFDTGNNYASSSSYYNNVGSYKSGGTTYGKFCGYIAESYNIDGSALAPTEFGEFDDDSGIWIPKEYTGSFPNNSWYLDFEDSSDLGANAKGDDRNFTLTNITAADQATDTPTNNFCTWNPLWVYLYQPIISEGATKVRYDNSTDENAKASIGLTNGKWYWEAKPVGTIGSQFIGIQTDGDDSLIRAQGITLNYTMTITPTGRYYSYAGSLSESSDQGWDLTASDWLGIALDMDSATQTIKYYKNGSLIQSLNLISQMQGQTVFPFLQNYENRSWDINFGGYTINTISSAASDGDGHGTFEYAPPSSHFAICTKNLAEYG